MTKKLVKMLKYTVYNLVKFAVALLRAGRGLKFAVAEVDRGDGDRRLASRRAWIEISCDRPQISILVSPCFAQGVD